MVLSRYENQDEFGPKVLEGVNLREESAQEVVISES